MINSTISSNFFLNSETYSKSVHIYKYKHAFYIKIVLLFNSPTVWMNFNFALIAPNAPMVGVRHHAMAVAVWLPIMFDGMLPMILATALFTTLQAEPQGLRNITLQIQMTQSYTPVTSVSSNHTVVFTMSFTMSSVVLWSASSFLHIEHSIDMPFFFRFFFTLFRLMAFPMCGHFRPANSQFILFTILSYTIKQSQVRFKCIFTDSIKDKHSL